MAQMLKYVCWICLCLCMFGCGTSKNQFEKGKYKNVVSSLKGKANRGLLNENELSMYIESVEQMAKNLDAKLQELYDSADVRDWQSGYLGLDKIEEKQLDYINSVQVRPEEMELLDIDFWDEKFGKKLYTYHWGEYNKEYENYIESEDKNHLITAHDQLHQLAAFAGEEIKIDSLKKDCLSLGKRTFTLDISDDSFNLFELRHLNNNVNPYNQKWSDFNHGGKADYQINVVLEDLDKDESKRTSDVRYSENIIIEYIEGVGEDGYTTQVPVFETVFADVKQTEYSFVVNARVDINIVWNKNHSIGHP